jgi:hypothetical protein
VKDAEPVGRDEDDVVRRQGADEDRVGFRADTVGPGGHGLEGEGDARPPRREVGDTALANR